MSSLREINLTYLYSEKDIKDITVGKFRREWNNLPRKLTVKL